MTAPPLAPEPFAAARARMVGEQLAARGLRDPAVLRAMGAVPRERFLPPEWRACAYEDRPLPIGDGQTISQPYMVAFMTELLAVAPGHRVLEIGTGSGYQTAVLCALGAEVCTVERIESLARRAEETVLALGFRARFFVGDGTLGMTAPALPDQSLPQTRSAVQGRLFDRILAAAAGPEVPASWRRQLAPHGRLVMPLGARDEQDVVLWEPGPAGGTLRVCCPCRFVPLIGAEGF